MEQTEEKKTAEEAYENLRNQYVTAADTDDAEGGSAFRKRKTQTGEIDGST